MVVFVFSFDLSLRFGNQATSPSQLWLNDLDALGAVLDEIAEAVKKQEQEDDKQRKIASKRKVYDASRPRVGRHLTLLPVNLWLTALLNSPETGLKATGLRAISIPIPIHIGRV